MSLRIGSMVTPLVASRQMNQTQREIESSMRSLASGTRFNRAGDDPATFAISELLRGQIGGLRAAQKNADNASSFLQVAEGGLQEQNNILIRLRELAIQSASDTVSEVERAFVESEFSKLVEEFDRIARATTFGRTPLLSGQGKDYEFHVGAHGKPEDTIRYRLEADTTAGTVGIDGLSVIDQSDARDALETLDEALTTVGAVRAEFGAIQGRLRAASDNLGVQNEMVTEARARMADTDVAFEVSNLARNQILQQAQVSVLAQANQVPAVALKLL
ncbi:MAG: flagellin [Pseudobdellovibrionaceae bacterium]